MRKLLLFACALFGFMACTQNPIEEQSAIRADASETLRVGFEDSETRIQLNSAQKTVWTKGDLVSVFYRSDANQKWQYQGETGERVGDLKRVDAGTATESTKRVVVVYPYNENYYINTETYNVQATLPATQHYLANSYGTDGNIMVSSSEYNQFSLKSVCGWLKLQLTGDGEVVKSIKFRGNDGEQVAGELYINSADATAMLASDMGGTDDNNAGGNLVFDDTILTEVVLDCGEGITLGKSATAFYIALPPQTFANGFTVEIEDADGYVMEQSTAKTFVVERNTISPMAALEFVNPNQPNQPTPANNEIWYTNGSTTNKTRIILTDGFGAQSVSHTYDTGKECWVIKFDGEVTKIGSEAFSYDGSLTSITIPDSVTKIGREAFSGCNKLTSIIIPDSVTSIGNKAFYNCSSLTSVTIGDSVTTIGDSAFFGCSSLTELKGEFVSNDGRCIISDGVLRYFLPSSLTEYTIPDGVTSIGNNAFYGCGLLTSITIPDSVTTIGDSAFRDCSSLTSITIPDSVTTIGDSAFRDCSSLTSVTIPDSVTTIGDSAFRDCSSLTSVTIPDSVTTIGDSAFYYCWSLTSVTIPDSVTTIGSFAFGDCWSLTSVTIPDSVTTIGNGAFEFCSSLTSVTIPNSVTSIGYEAFYNCSSLTSVTIPDGVTKIEDDTFCNCRSLTSVTICNNVTTIGNSAFADCSSLTSVTIPDSVTSIGNYAFYNCSSLTSVTIPDSVTTIEGGAFSGCISLTSVTIPDSVTTIGNYTFYGCSNLKSVYCKATEPPVATYDDDDHWHSFDNNSSGRKIYVPTESVRSYMHCVGWGFYESDIVGCSFGSYTVTLNNAWRESTSVSSPDSWLYDGVYESYSNYNVDSGVATMYIDIEGYTEFSIYIRSDAETSYDYVTVSELDSTSVKVSTKGEQNSGTAISNYTKVAYTGIDKGLHRITVTYRKDSSQHNGTDRGYLLIPKNQ